MTVILLSAEASTLVAWLPTCPAPQMITFMSWFSQAASNMLLARAILLSWWISLIPQLTAPILMPMPKGG